LFLLIVGIGGVLGLVGISWFVDYSIEHFEYPMRFLFLGVVCGGLPVLYKEANVGVKKKSDIIYFIIGALLIAGLIILDHQNDGTLINLASNDGLTGFIFLFIAGIIVAIALILPGISTSFLLLTLGLYEPTIDAIKTINLGYLIPLLIGVAFGIITTTKILENFMKKKPRPTYLLIIGFVIASMLEVFPGLPSGLDILYSIILFVAGFFIIRYISEKYAD
jgi:putative membrane protein